MNYADLHCDTPLEMFDRGESLASGSLNVILDKLGFCKKYLQLAAYCPNENIGDDEGYEKFLRVRDNFLNECTKVGASVAKSADELKSSVDAGKPTFVLTLEDGRVLSGSLSRLHKLYESGVRVLTPLWGGETCIGGSHQSTAGLTKFGRDVAELCGELGVITDISHASERSANEILEIAGLHGRPVIASHSCSATLNPHSRNLSDDLLRKTARSGGIVGVNFYPPHLTGGTATLLDVVRHVKHYVSIVGDGHVALGCDFDGMGIFPEDAHDVTAVERLYSLMAEDGFSNEALEKIFFTNAYDFLINNL